MIKRIILALLLGVTCCLTTGAHRWIPPQVAASGPNTWYNTAAAGSHTGNNGATSTNVRRSPVVVSQAGTATQLRVYVDTFTSAVTVKMGLYDGGTLIGSITPVASATTGYLVGTLTSSVAVTAKTYYLAYECSSSTSNTQFSNNASITTGDADSTLYAAAMPSTYTAVFSSQACYDMSVFVQ